MSLVAIGASSRLSLDGYVPLGYSNKHEGDINQYRRVVLETSSILGMNPTDHQIETLADNWLNRLESGELKPLHSEAIDDSMTEGPKAAIFSSANKLQSRMMNVSNFRATHGDFAGGQKMAIKCLKLLEFLKYSDFQTVNYFSNEQRHIVYRLTHILGTPTSETKAALLAFYTGQRDLSRIQAQTVNLVQQYNIRTQSSLKLRDLPQEVKDAKKICERMPNGKGSENLLRDLELQQGLAAYNQGCLMKETEQLLAK